MNLRRIALLVPFALLATGCALAPVTTSTPTPGRASTAGGATPGQEGTVTCSYRPGGTPAKPVDPPDPQQVPASGTSTAVIDFGDAQVTVELDRAAAPCTVHSFENLATQGFYDGSECHRLATQRIFILQCGDPTGTGQGGPGYTFDDEVKADTTYPAGVLAMANAGPNTNGSQFFFVYADTPLPPAYTVFGRLDEASNQVIADRAFQGHDATHPDGTGRPNVPTAIRTISFG